MLCVRGSEHPAAHRSGDGARMQGVFKCDARAAPGELQGDPVAFHSFERAEGIEGCATSGGDM